MGRQPHLLYPSIHRVLVDIETLGDILNSNPSFFIRHFISLCTVLPESCHDRQVNQEPTDTDETKPNYTQLALFSQRQTAEYRKSTACWGSDNVCQPNGFIQCKFQSEEETSLSNKIANIYSEQNASLEIFIEIKTQCYWQGKVLHAQCRKPVTLH